MPRTPNDERDAASKPTTPPVRSDPDPRVGQPEPATEPDAEIEPRDQGDQTEDNRRQQE